MEHSRTGDFTAFASLRVYRTNAKTCIDTKVTSTSSVMFPTSLRLLEIASAIRSVTQRVAKWRYVYIPIDIWNLIKAIIRVYIILNGTALVQKHGEQISWKTIESLYLSETTTSTMGVRLCHKLTRDHVWLTSHNRMRVYLAAQVRVISFFYHDTGNEWKCGQWPGIYEPWRYRADTVDQFFDYLNVKNSKLCDWKRKPSRAPYKNSRIRTHEMSAWRYCR